MMNLFIYHKNDKLGSLTPSTILWVRGLLWPWLALRVAELSVLCDKLDRREPAS